MHTLPNLPYSFDALEPYIDTETMKIHHGKHHQTYIDKLNMALEKYPELADKPVEDLLRDFSVIPEEIKTAVRNHGGGHANHSLFWTILGLGKENNLPEGKINEAINLTFGSFAEFKKLFSARATGQFGSGWAWLVQNSSGILEIVSQTNQDSPIISVARPIL